MTRATAVGLLVVRLAAAALLLDRAAELLAGEPFLARACFRFRRAALPGLNQRLPDEARESRSGGLAVLIVLFNLIADVLYGILDPRIRYD